MNEETEKWITKGLNDYKTAEKLLNLPEDEIITDTLCFHAQQAVEKLLKAFLVENNIEFGRTHDIEYLIKLCSQKDSEFSTLIGSVKNLTDYAVEVRYPDDFYIPTLDEAREAFEAAKKVKEFVFKKLGIRN